MKARHPYRLFTEYYYRWKGLNASTTFHSHPQYEVYYFHDGNCHFMLGDRIIELAPGDMIIMNGMTQHCPKVAKPADYVRTMFSFEPYLVQIFSEEMRAFNPLQPFETLGNYHLRLDPEAKAECEELLHRINKFYYKDDVVRYHRLLMAFYDLLLFINEQCRKPMEDNRRTVTDRERYVRQMIAFIENRYMDDVQLDGMANELHMSRYHMMKIFRDVTGMTVFDYLYRRRINQAKLLFFYKKENSVTDVCFRVGFKHLPHFSRLFKHQVGISPDQYRKMIHGTGGEGMFPK